ncbi:MAG: hypothetical protein V4614_11670 [Pseudomonadota bacterium]
MSVFNWLSRKSDKPEKSGRNTSLPSGSGDSSGLRDSRGRKPVQMPVPRPGAPEAASRSELRKTRRHARREQLYVAVREAMTRAGVLAASYKFKVLSLDQRGDQFLVMMDVASTLGHQPETLAIIESLVVQTARARFEIVVTSVYWRSEATTVQSKADATLAVAPAPAPAFHNTVALPPLDMPIKKPASRYDPIQEEEVTAFKQALAAASAAAPEGKARTGLHSYTLLTGFEDTEMPETAAAPALSATQYGDLN